MGKSRNTLKGKRSGIVQVAGIIDREEAEMLLRLGVDWLGFPFELPVHKEDLTRKEATAIITYLKCFERAVLITYLNRAKEILTLCKDLGALRVQIHGDISQPEIETLREMAPHLFLIKSLVVAESNLRRLEKLVKQLSPWVDAFITDTYDPETKASGATGKAHDWSISRALVSQSPKPVFLAGGLNPQNVRKAICTVHPAGVDAHTGVEGKSGRKDQKKVERFVREARAGFKLA